MVIRKYNDYILTAESRTYYTLRQLEIGHMYNNGRTHVCQTNPLVATVWSACG